MPFRDDFATRRNKDFARDFHLRISGDGPETIILANGFGLDQQCWNALLPWLEARAKVVRFDWPIDASHIDVRRYSRLEGFAADLLAIVDFTKAAPCTLIAHSMSGMIGMLAGKARPEYFRRMVMIAPAPRYIAEEGFPAGFSETTVEALLTNVEDDYQGWLMQFAPFVAGPSARPEIAKDFSRSLRAMRPDAALTLAQLIFRMDMRAQLDGFNVPTAIVQPRKDPAVPVEIGQYLAKSWPRARLEIIETTGHLPQMSDPDIVIEALERALAAD